MLDVRYLFKVLQQRENSVHGVVVFGLFQLGLGVIVFGSTPDVHSHLNAHNSIQDRKRESKSAENNGETVRQTRITNIQQSLTDR